MAKRQNSDGQPKKKAKTSRKKTTRRQASKKQDVERHPITPEGLVGIGGVPSPGVSTGAVDKVKAQAATKMERAARLAGVAGGMRRNAGLMMNEFGPSQFNYSNTSLDAYHTSYATGNTMYGGGTRDIPTYFVMMNQQNGGVLYWPVSLREKYEWYRYFVRCCYIKTYNADVLMADGTTKSLKDIEIGDEVITGIGSVRRVKEKFERRFKEEKAVTLNAWCLHEPLQTTHHHPYYILRESSVKNDHKYKKEIDFNPEWVHAEHLNVGDYVLMAPVESDPNSKITTEEARFLGYYAAEGSIIWGKRCVGTDEDGKGYKWRQEKVKVPVGVSFTINLSEKDTLGAGILRTAKEVFGVDGRIVRERGNSVEIAVNGREVGEFCFYHVGTGSATKRLSSELVLSSNEARREYLVGYMEGDGCQYGAETTNCGKIVIGTSSPFLATQTQVMAIGAGVMCRIAKYKRTPNSGFNGESPKTDQWHITIPRWSAEKLVTSSDKWECVAKHTYEQKRCAFFIGGYAAFKIKEITYSQEDDTVYNIEVDAEGDEKSYVCNGMVTHNTDAYVGRAMELLSDLPMSKMTLRMPKLKSKRKQEEVQEYYEHMCDRINLFNVLQQILWEWNSIGNCFAFHEWSEKDKMWSKIVILPPEEVQCFTYPFSDNARVEYRPQKLIDIIKAADNKQGMGDDIAEQIISSVPEDVKKMIIDEDCIVLDSNPMAGGNVGSFVEHFARRRSPYMDLGVSVLERVLVPMLVKENFRYTQLAMATRNMTPKNKISAPGLTQPELDDLRTQIDLSYMDPDYSIVTNYEWDWEQIGAEGRILDLQGEYEMLENQVFAALGVTRELLTGEGTYSGNRITVEILNTVFLLTREMLQKYVEKSLFEPVAEAHEWYEKDRNGIKHYYYPRLSFNRLSIRDNQEVFENLFQLYQKGSLPISTIYELYNLDNDSIHEELKDTLFTVQDSTFNRAIEEINSEAGRALAERSDAVDQIGKYLGFKVKPAEGEGDFGGGDFGGEFGGGFGDEEAPAEGGGIGGFTNDEVGELTETIADDMPEGSTEEDVREVVKEVMTSEDTG